MHKLKMVTGRAAPEETIFFYKKKSLSYTAITSTTFSGFAAFISSYVENRYCV